MNELVRKLALFVDALCLRSLEFFSDLMLQSRRKDVTALKLFRAVVLNSVPEMIKETIRDLFKPL